MSHWTLDLSTARRLRQSVQTGEVNGGALSGVEVFELLAEDKESLECLSVADDACERRPELVGQSKPVF
jgi:hypothetical protein